MNETVKIEDSSVRLMLDYLEPRQLRSATRSAFGKAGRTILGAAKASYRSMFPGSALYRGMHMKAYRSGKGVMVDLYYTKTASPGDPLYKSYVLKILELGSYKTGNRTTRSGQSRGTLRAYGFFSRGVASSMPSAQSGFERDLMTAMQRQIDKAK